MQEFGREVTIKIRTERVQQSSVAAIGNCMCVKKYTSFSRRRLQMYPTPVSL